MTKERLQRNIESLHTLSKAKRKNRNSLITDGNGDMVMCICDCANNILKGNVALNKDQYAYLQKYRCTLRQLSNKKLKIKDRKDILVNQRGGFLPSLLIPVLSVAGSLLAEIIRK